MSADNRKTLVVNPGFQYRVAFTAVLVVVLSINLLILIASLAPELIGVELVLGKIGYYVIGAIELIVIFGGWRWSISATHKVAGPVYAMGRELAKLADGNLMFTIKLRPKDEFHDTAARINDSVAALRDKIDRAKQLAVDLETEHDAGKLQEIREILLNLKTRKEDLDTNKGGVTGK